MPLEVKLSQICLKQLKVEFSSFLKVVWTESSLQTHLATFLPIPDIWEPQNMVVGKIPMSATILGTVADLWAFVVAMVKYLESKSTCLFAPFGLWPFHYPFSKVWGHRELISWGKLVNGLIRPIWSHLWQFCSISVFKISFSELATFSLSNSFDDFVDGVAWGDLWEKFCAEAKSKIWMIHGHLIIQKWAKEYFPMKNPSLK